ncbi:hypothetical protein CFF91_16600 [Salmonella enterica]|nr:hypothetical protein [Salmonella enterica]EDC7490629.1 hypothetical protein [Salmonella enterica]
MSSLKGSIILYPQYGFGHELNTFPKAKYKNNFYFSKLQVSQENGIHIRIIYLIEIQHKHE